MRCFTAGIMAVMREKGKHGESTTAKEPADVASAMQYPNDLDAALFDAISD